MTNARSIDFRFVDLFAGVGGFHHALAGLGGECVLAVELDSEARSVYQASFPEMEPAAIVHDIRSLTRQGARPDAAELDGDAIRALVPEHDVLCAGFPCQPFSKSGFQEGVRDRTRGTLFFDVMSIVLARQPRFVILENVRNLAGPRHTATWDTIIESFRDAGYVVADEPAILSPHLLRHWEGGAPQVRERVFILAHRARPGLAVEERTGEPLAVRHPDESWDPHEWRIEEHLDPKVDAERYRVRPEEAAWLAAWQAFVQMIPDEMLPGFPIWADAFERAPSAPPGSPAWKKDFIKKNSDFYRLHHKEIDLWRRARFGPTRMRVEDFPASRRKFEWQARREQPTAADRDLDALVAHFRPSGIRVKAPSYLPALVAINQTSLLGPKVTGQEAWRRLAPQEAARLQGIPFAGFESSGVPDRAIYRQLGNAVNVGVVRYAARALFDAGGVSWSRDNASRAG